MERLSTIVSDDKADTRAKIVRQVMTMWGFLPSLAVAPRG
jgi:hypothetical protein